MRAGELDAEKRGITVQREGTVGSTSFLSPPIFFYCCSSREGRLISPEENRREDEVAISRPKR